MTRVILENVSVEFPIYGAQHLSLRNAIAQRAIGGLIERDTHHKNGVIVKALTDINLKLEDGDRLGLVGHNGSGKSTLLKVLAGIYEPVSGRISVNGRVTPLFDMMPGLDVDDTGYENIMTSGLLLGMTREEILRKIPEIEEVSELGDYLRLPVRTYSAGMTTRLGFALVTALDPDVLILDEGFGAADLRFTQRTAERVDELIGRSRAMVLATHSDAMMESICNKAALMKEGRLLHVGPVAEILSEYQAMTRGLRPQVSGHAIENDAGTGQPGDGLENEGLADKTYSDDEKRQASSTSLSARNDREGSGSIRFYDVTARFKESVSRRGHGSLSLTISILNRSLHNVVDFDIAIGIDDENSNRVKTIILSQDMGGTLSMGVGSGSIELECSDVSGLSGNYYVTLFSKQRDEILDWVRYAGTFDVAPHGESKESAFAESWDCRFVSSTESIIAFNSDKAVAKTRQAS